MLKDTEVRSASQAPLRLGHITLKSGPRGTSSALVPILRPFEGSWAIAGLVRVDLRRQPTSRSQRRRAIRGALRQVRRELEGGPGR